MAKKYEEDYLYTLLLNLQKHAFLYKGQLSLEMDAMFCGEKGVNP